MKKKAVNESSEISVNYCATITAYPEQPRAKKDIFPPKCFFYFVTFIRFNVKKFY